MADKFTSLRNIKFLLHEVLRAQDLSALPYFADHDQESQNLMLETALRISQEVLFPALGEMDRQAPTWQDGQVRVHPAVRQFMELGGEGGWVAAPFPEEVGGMQMPITVNTACHFIFSAANFSCAVYMGLTSGAAHLILSFGDQQLKDTYLPPMFAGRWQGTMALTEPQAGSSLSDVAMSAQPTDQGYYLLSGQKIFISGSDSDAVDNVVNLMLARIKGAPAGVKGISLFVVPKLRPEGDKLAPNDVTTAGIFHKLGYKGCPILHLSLGEENDCRGWLVGEPHRGLSYMFQMMNEERIAVGNDAAGVASAAYYASLQYARERLQGRPLGAKDPSQPQVPIIRHPDIRRLLLFQRSVAEGSIALILQAAKYADLAAHGPEEQRQDAFLLLDLLTPVVKSFPSEMGVLSTSAGLQILGGYGYTDEFPLEQHFRDMRIHPIHEGTTAIHGLDILGRKVTQAKGRGMGLLRREVETDLKAAATQEALAPYAGRLREGMELLEEITGLKTAVLSQGRTEDALADASLYLEMFGQVVVAWQWLKQGLAASAGLTAGAGGAEAAFYQGKLTTMRYFFHYELPKIHALASRLREDDGLTVALEDECFND